MKGIKHIFKTQKERNKRYCLYKIERYNINNSTDENFINENQMKINIFKPRIGNLYIDNLKNFKKFIFALYWYIINCGKFTIYYLEKEGVIIHTSYCCKRCYKFPFMKANDLHIGPCKTEAAFRGLGIYPLILREIQKDFTAIENFYLIIEEENIASQRGALKAGFKKTGFLRRTKYTKKYFPMK